MSIAVIGAGAFGTALAVTLATKTDVTLWGRDTDWASTGENPRLPGVALPENLRVTDDLDAVQANTVLLGLPAQVLGGFLTENAARLNGRNLISCAKGIDLSTLTGPSALIAKACPASIVAVLTGPSFAADIARGLPTALTLACADALAAKHLQSELSTATLRLYRTSDMTGAELGGALKNVIAIAAGAAIGAGYGDSARASVITRGFAEMTRLAAALGARPETLTGLSGLGDLVLTCTSEQSRNFRYGLALGAGRDFASGTTVEGAATARAVAALAPRLGVELPVSQLVAGLAEGRIAMEHALDILLNRPLKEE
ncbi:NAD(P)H-dependent glycerol-3-phosphate dehydrogenase [Paracoccus aestuariivivens]|uniref:Glycerol-3-phosphate dehydrogenase [NAD(P)+] n=1 Tax=Paracoccus aestuariivivens TaxID=1820333 RepID=A0A6L6JCT8_9RHOB|nr:NAD(P)H-dependent glycerol-3-phosphate dehydrogenase [Paracoccus aestuariivivens]MTH78978.1 NAD(P)H-dependent glycerol-3-phosphate dehydrogenase [Paracoccus aestuariivivens]